VNGRLISGIVALLVLVPISAGLLVSEQVAVRSSTDATAATPLDPLAALQFVPSQRKENFLKMGFSEAEVTEILTRVTTLEKKLNIGIENEDVIRFLIDQTEELTVLENGLCGRTNPARYTALQLLVEEKGDELRLRDLSGMPAFEVMDWYSTDRPVALVAALEQVSNREPDATRMGLAAVFAREVPTALSRKPPWGQSFWNNWSWEGVTKKWPGVTGKVQGYVAILHLVLENVTGDGGLCRTQ
jgi:hypothetical protein